MHPSLLPPQLAHTTSSGVLLPPEQLNALNAFSNWSTLPFNQVDESFTRQLYGHFVDDLQGEIFSSLSICPLTWLIKTSMDNQIAIVQIQPQMD